MIRQDLLNKELEFYKRRNKELKPIKYNRDTIFNLFRKYKNYGMTENSYCCHGEEFCCWQELVEEGNWNLTLRAVRGDILRNLRYARYFIRNRKSGDRMYMYQDKDCCYIYIYCRDIFEIQTDYAIWFDNKKE